MGYSKPNGIIVNIPRLQQKGSENTSRERIIAKIHIFSEILHGEVSLRIYNNWPLTLLLHFNVVSFLYFDCSRCCNSLLIILCWCLHFILSNICSWSPCYSVLVQYHQQFPLYLEMFSKDSWNVAHLSSKLAIAGTKSRNNPKYYINWFL